jgi:hypothetical protein
MLKNKSENQPIHNGNPLLYPSPQSGINLTKQVKDENYKILKKETEEDSKRWKDCPCSWIITINSVKMAILFRVTYRFNDSM